MRACALYKRFETLRIATNKKTGNVVSKIHSKMKLLVPSDFHVNIKHILDAKT